ncbi:rolling circle replication-associated protein, partial [Streptomyces sp. NPDC054887]
MTYKKNMTDTKKLYSDFQNFIDRLRYKYKKESSIDYLSVVEPQGRGAWHCHVLMRFNDLDKI